MANYSVVHDTVYKYDHSFHGLKACFKRRISSASHLVQMSNHCLSLFALNSTRQKVWRTWQLPLYSFILLDDFARVNISQVNVDFL